MSNPIYSIAHSVRVADRGLVLVPEPEIDGDSFQTDDVLLIERPDGSRIHPRIQAIEILSGCNGSQWILILSRNLTRDDVPKGSTFQKQKNQDA